MNFKDTLTSAELVISTNEVPLIIGESGIGKTALARELGRRNQWSLVVIDGNLLKEGEIGGLPTVEDYEAMDSEGEVVRKKATIYATHTKLKEIDEKILKGEKVLLFIDEINRCDHSVQQELMNLILNREINGYKLHEDVKILAAMNPSSKYGADFDYQVVDMDAAQENRFVWLQMESDPSAWIEWALRTEIEDKVIEFISTFPEHLHSIKEDDIRATPRSYERVSKIFTVYRESNGDIPRKVFLNVLKGNLGKIIAEEFISFVEADHNSLVTFEEAFQSNELSEEIISKLKEESHTRLYLTAANILRALDKEILKADEDKKKKYIERLIEVLKLYPIDLMVGVMKDIKENYDKIYKIALENTEFIEAYFSAYSSIRG